MAIATLAVGILLLIAAGGLTLSWLLYKRVLHIRYATELVPTVMLALSATLVTFWARHESSRWVWMIILGIASIINVPGLAAAVLLNGITPQSLVPPWSYVAAAGAFWLGWFFFGRVVRWWSKRQ